MMQAVALSGNSEVGCSVLSEGVKEANFETGSAKFYGTVHENPSCLSKGRINHIDV